MDNPYYLRFENWLNGHTHRSRIYILLIGWSLIFFFWYYLLEKPLNEKKITSLELKESADIQHQDFDKESAAIVKKASENQALALSNEEELKQFRVIFVPPNDTSRVIKQILMPHQNISFTSWKEIDVVTSSDLKPEPAKKEEIIKNAYQLIFQSDFFSTKDYLDSLEKLPWCLAWDSLEYIVVKYPEAAITINLRFMDAG